MGQKKPLQQCKLEIAWERRQLCRAGPEVQSLLKMSQQCALEATRAKTLQAASADSNPQLLPSTEATFGALPCPLLGFPVKGTVLDQVQWRSCGA